MIIDTPDDASTQIVHLQADSVTTVIRYLTSTPRSSKLVTPREARALAAAGIRLGVVFEIYGGADGVDDIESANGAADAAFCLKYLSSIGAPADGTVCVYFAIDTDFSPRDVQQKVVPYFTAIAAAFLADRRYFVGVYGSGLVCQTICEGGLAVCGWLSGSKGWTNTRAILGMPVAPRWLALIQDKMDTRLANMDVDTNIVVKPFGDFMPVFNDAQV